MKIHLTLLMAVVPVFALCRAGRADGSPPVAWISQDGTAGSDISYGVAAGPSGGAYIAGTTRGSLGGTNAGYLDVYLSRYDRSGNVVWARQLGTPSYEEAFGVAADTFGNVYVTGITEGSLGGPNAGESDIFLSRYDASGNAVWTAQMGTSEEDESYGVAIGPAGSIYIAGRTGGSLGGPSAGSNDVFLSKYDSSGSAAWTRQVGSSASDHGYGVAADAAGNIYVSGTTHGSMAGPNLGQRDAFVSKFDSDGNSLWTRQAGTPGDDWSHDVAVDAAGNVYMAGLTSGSLAGPSAGDYDAFLLKYDAAGNGLWARQFGTASDDYGFSVAVDAAGNAYVSGITGGSLGGANAGSVDVFASKYGPDGTAAWTVQLGTDTADWGHGVAVNAAGRIFLTGGRTLGDLGGPNTGHEDPFLVMLAPAAVQVTIDIRPESDENPLNLMASGVLPVVILGSDTFDVAEIDQATLALAESTPEERGKSGNVGVLEDVNDDGFLDLALLFPIRGLKLDPDAVLAELTGDLLDGTPIEGSDWVRLLRAGDANLDGFVDIQDFGILKDNFAVGAGWIEGDFNEDGIVDMQDFFILKDHFGQGGGGLENAPEPASAVLLLIGLPWLPCLAGRQVHRRCKR